MISPKNDISEPGTRYFCCNATAETSRRLAQVVSLTAPKQRERVFHLLIASKVALTPEQITTELRKRGGRDMLMSIRARCSELVRLDLIEDSGLRGKGTGGRTAIKWRVKDANMVGAGAR